MGRTNEIKGSLEKDLDRDCYVLKLDITKAMLEEFGVKEPATYLSGIPSSFPTLKRNGIVGIDLATGNDFSVLSLSKSGGRMIGKHIYNTICDDFIEPQTKKETQMKKFIVAYAGSISYFFTRAEALEYMKNKCDSTLFVADVNCVYEHTSKQAFVKVK
jgi:hypothetical protein